MELADLRAFLQIAEQGSISEAARVLKQPKSSVSRGLARLEESVGAALVDRSSQHLRLTDAGALLRPRAAKLLDDANDALVALDGLGDTPRGRLRINVPFTFAVGLVGPMLSRFVEAYPDIQVDLDIDNKLVNLHAADLDLAVRVGTLADSDLVAQRLTCVELWACASPVYLAKHGWPVRPGDLAGHRLIARVDEVSRWGFVDADGTRVEIEVDPHLVIPEPAVMMTVAVDGSGIARLPDFLATPSIHAGKLIRVLPDYLPDRVDVHVLYTAGGRCRPRHASSSRRCSSTSPPGERHRAERTASSGRQSSETPTARRVPATLAARGGPALAPIADRQRRARGLGMYASRASGGLKPFDFSVRHSSNT